MDTNSASGNPILSRRSSRKRQKNLHRSGSNIALIVGAATLIVVLVALCPQSSIFKQIKETLVVRIQQVAVKATVNSYNSSPTMNSVNYSWVGNHWIPPPGIPMYRPEEIKAVFQRRNVLFMGDSTCRRAYATLYAMMNSSSPNDISVQDLDRARVIDVNKGRTWEYCQDRNFDPNMTTRGQLGTNATFICRTVPGSPSGLGKMDMGKSNCYMGWVNFFNADLTMNKGTLRDYDLVVLLGGIWESTRARDCRAPDDGGALVRLKTTIETLQNASGPNLQIIWRTTGFDGRHTGDEMNLQLISRSKELIDNQQGRYNLTYVDWGSQIDKRSFGETRIKGDLHPHYGLEARLLFAQMLMHELVKR